MKSQKIDEKKKIFVANPFGFSEAGRFFLRKHMIPSLKKSDFSILDPWSSFDADSKKFEQILDIKNKTKQKKALSDFNGFIAARNEKQLRESHILIAVLDGTDVDSGTAAEIGLAYGLGKKIIGYRGDIRKSGENSGVQVNLQVEHDIIQSGGKIITSINELKQTLKKK